MPSISNELSEKLNIDCQICQESRLASIKDESSSSKSIYTSKASAVTSLKTGFSPTCASVTADEIRAALSSVAPLTTQELVERFKWRLKSQEVC